MAGKTKYKPEYDQAIIDFFNRPRTRIVKEKLYYKNGSIREYEKEIPADLPFLGSFAHSIGVTHQTLIKWAEDFPSFSKAYARAKEIQEEFLANNALRGLYNAHFAFQTAKNVCGWRDVKEQNVSGDLTVTVNDTFQKTIQCAPCNDIR
jgi:hypothetical protein